MKKVPLKDLVTSHLRRQFGGKIIEGDGGNKLVNLCLKAIEMADAGHGTRSINKECTADSVIRDAKLDRFLKKH